MREIKVARPPTITEMMSGSGAMNGRRPWDDRALSAEVRYNAYRDFLVQKADELLAIGRRPGISVEELIALAKEPENIKLKEELERLTSETAEQFCARRDQGALCRELLGKNFLGAEEWKKRFKVDVGPVPPIPKWINKKLLEEESQLHPGQQVKDTHILVLVPKTVDGKPYSAVKLGELCAGTKGSGDRLIYDGADWANAWKSQSWAKESPSESEWVLIPKSDPDPNKVAEDKHFRSKTIAGQAEVLKHYEADYREAKALEVMTAALLNDVVNGEQILSDCYLRTREPNASGGRVVVGGFDANGLKVSVDDDGHGYVYVGGALARKSRS